jgi:hypothetical protein
VPAPNGAFRNRSALKDIFMRGKTRTTILSLLFATLCAFSASGATSLLQQSVVAPGTILPIRLNSSLSSRKSKPGDVISGRIMQDVPLQNGSSIHRGTRVMGRVLSVAPAANGGDAQISFQFDSIQSGHSAIAVTTNLRALASPSEIDDAQLPLYGGDRGTPSTAYTTVQIGNDEVVYRGGGPVARGDIVVGKPVYGGVLVTVSSAPDAPCRGAIEGNNQPQALWLFSSDACGVYGYAGVSISHAGRTNPSGQIVLSTSGRELNIRGGSGMLLRVDPQ